MNDARLKLLLEIDPMAEPVAGMVREGPGPSQMFTGWTQLGHALDVAITEARHRAGAPHEGSPPHGAATIDDRDLQEDDDDALHDG